MDDYQYKSELVPDKQQWPNALGNQGSVQLRGLGGKSSSVAGVSGTGANTGAPNIGNTNSSTNSFGGGLPDGVSGDMLYHDGDDWVVFNKPDTNGILTIASGVPEWITATDKALIYFDPDEDAWQTLSAPSDTGTFVLGFVDGVLEWMQTTDCGATGP